MDARSRLGRLTDKLLGLHDTPERTAAAFALGVFFSFSPFLGLQILLSMTIAVVCRLNRLAVFAGLNANLPWFLVPWYAGTTLAASAVLGVTIPDDASAILGALLAEGWPSASAFRQAASLVVPILVPFLVGPTIGAALVGLVAYVTTRAILVRRAASAAVIA